MYGHCGDCWLIAGIWPWTTPFNTLRPRQNGCHFADDIFKCIFLNENIWIPIEISLKFVSKGSINNDPALFQIMAWCRPGNKPLSEPIVVSSLTHIYVTRPQWVNTLMPRLDDYNFSVYQCVFKFLFLYKVYCIMIEISLQSVSIDLIVNKSPLVQVMAWPLPKLMMIHLNDAYRHQPVSMVKGQLHLDSTTLSLVIVQYLIAW